MAFFTRLPFGTHGNRDPHEGFPCATSSFTVPVTCDYAGEPGRNTQTARPGYRERVRRLPALSRGRPDVARLAGTARLIPLGVLTPTREHNFEFRTGSPMRPCDIASSWDGPYRQSTIIQDFTPCSPYHRGYRDFEKNYVNDHQSTIDICGTRIPGSRTPLA